MMIPLFWSSISSIVPPLTFRKQFWSLSEFCLKTFGRADLISCHVKNIRGLSFIKSVKTGILQTSLGVETVKFL